MRIALVQKSENNAVWFYRLLPWQYLSRQSGGAIQIQVVRPDNLTAFESVIAAYDVIIFHCPHSKRDFEAMCTAKDYNVKVVIDYDDLIFDVPNVNRASAFYNREGTQEAIINCYKIADAVTVSTDALADEIEKMFGKRPTVINNAHNDLCLPGLSKFNQPQNGVNTILWRGSETHIGDLMRYRDAFEQYENIDWNFWGGVPDLAISSKYGGRMESWTHKGWEPGIPNYFRNLKNLKPNFVLVPLELGRFNDCKSNIAYLEATYAGAVCIATEVKEFDRLGVVTFENTSELTNILEQVNSGEIDWQTYHMEAVADLEKNYRLSKVNQLRADLLQKLYAA